MHKGTIKEYDPKFLENYEKRKSQWELEHAESAKEKKGKNDAEEFEEDKPDGPHHVFYFDNDVIWTDLSNEIVIWDNGIVTGNTSSWKGDPNAEKESQAAKEEEEEKPVLAGPSVLSLAPPPALSAEPSKMESATIISRKSSREKTGDAAKAQSAEPLGKKRDASAAVTTAATAEEEHAAVGGEQVSPQIHGPLFIVGKKVGSGDGGAALGEREVKKQKLANEVAPFAVVAVPGEKKEEQGKIEVAADQEMTEAAPSGTAPETGATATAGAGAGAGAAKDKDKTEAPLTQDKAADSSDLKKPAEKEVATGDKSGAAGDVEMADAEKPTVAADLKNAKDAAAPPRKQKEPITAGGKKQQHAVGEPVALRRRLQDAKPVHQRPLKDIGRAKRVAGDPSKVVSPIIPHPSGEQAPSPALAPPATALPAGVGAVGGGPDSELKALWAEKAQRLEKLGKEYLDALEVLKRTIPEIDTLAKELNTAIGKEKVEILSDSAMIKNANTLVRSTMNVALPGGKQPAGFFEAPEGLNWLDTIPDPMLNLMKAINRLRTNTKREGPMVRAFLSKREFAKKASGSSSPAGGKAAPPAGTPAGPAALAPASGPAAAGGGGGGAGPSMGRPPLPPSAGKKPLTPKTTTISGAAGAAVGISKNTTANGGAVDGDGSLVRSTGNEMRDKAVRVLAHSMVTATSAVDAALEIETVLFNRYCAGTGVPNTDYYDKVRRIYEALSPKSPICHPILRHMLLTGMLSPADLVSITAEELKQKEEEAKQELVQCRPGWLAEQLRNVQLPHKPPQNNTTNTANNATTIPAPSTTAGVAGIAPPSVGAFGPSAQAVAGAVGVPPGKVVSSGTSPLPAPVNLQSFLQGEDAPGVEQPPPPHSEPELPPGPPGGVPMSAAGMGIMAPPPPSISGALPSVAGATGVGQNSGVGGRQPMISVLQGYQVIQPTPNSGSTHPVVQAGGPAMPAGRGSEDVDMDLG